MTLDNNLLKKITDFKKFIINIVPIASDDTPLSDDTNGSIGTSFEYARSDHVHPTDTSRLAVNQGSGNSGKFLKVSSNGNITTETVSIPTVVNTVSDGNNNAVSSNAVYDYVDTIIGDIEEDMLS